MIIQILGSVLGASIVALGCFLVWMAWSLATMFGQYGVSGYVFSGFCGVLVAALGGLLIYKMWVEE